MARPSRNANANEIASHSRTFFVTTNTSAGRALLQSERNALLFVDVLRFYVTEKRFLLHDFVIMPNHVHLLITVESDTTIEKAVQLIKGGFSYRLQKEFGYLGEVWQRGFSEVRVIGEESFAQHRRYIAENPVKAGLVKCSDEFPYCFSQMARRKAQGLKPPDTTDEVGTAKAVP